MKNNYILCTKKCEKCGSVMRHVDTTYRGNDFVIFYSCGNCLANTSTELPLCCPFCHCKKTAYIDTNTQRCFECNFIGSYTEFIMCNVMAKIIFNKE